MAEIRFHSKPIQGRPIRVLVFGPVHDKSLWYLLQGQMSLESEGKRFEIDSSSAYHPRSVREVILSREPDIVVASGFSIGPFQEELVRNGYTLCINYEVDDIKLLKVWLYRYLERSYQLMKSAAGA